MAPKTKKAQVPPLTCTTLLEDEETKCPKPRTHGNPVERCQMHHKQYIKLTKKYKQAAQFVDKTLGEALIPTKEEILSYDSIHDTLEKARLMKKYVSAIRQEKLGREVHHRRLFLKIDSGHKIRLNLLAKKMSEAVEIRDALEARALTLHMKNDTGREEMEEFQALPLDGLESESAIDVSPKAIAEYYDRSIGEKAGGEQGNDTLQEDDLIDLKLRRHGVYLTTDKILYCLEILLEPEAFMKSFYHKTTGEVLKETAHELRSMEIFKYATQQYARRILFHEPTLYLKTLDKVSFKDLFMDDDFDLDDLIRFMIVFSKRLEFGLLWWKDSVIEALALAVRPGSNTANLGDLGNRFKIVGGWIYNRSHKGTTTDEAWWVILNSFKGEPTKNIENRFVRLCNSFDDLHAFLSFAALGLLESPSFCTKHSYDLRGIRNHMSFCGVLITDMVSTGMGNLPPGPLPSTKPASRPGYRTWVCVESRSYMFGAVRNEPDDFVDAFLKELRCRPDMFYVVTRSETAPGREVETFGTVSAQMRSRMFEARIGDSAPRVQGEWSVTRSATDVLYGTGERKVVKGFEGLGSVPPGIVGYLTALDRPKSAGWFFHFKKFPVKYFVIMDAEPNRQVSHLARNVAWAAFRAQGRVTGSYGAELYARASDKLVQEHAKKRLSEFLPSDSWYVGNLHGSY
ncbi:uncharacterized protein EV420DRAFT_1258562 [Desarmillaria tabescens]|uniref:Uncharacterized protein n=1 Tax=Armillaria tabescens TaxID=1929756 RepID=A0AA39NPV6_ARMTA|nr:uncharacterized protein EV420DRAFT_1258562 [Desarmillaria tabescens]KAK0469490.1 hypothetical protein EV420DRAFT_1258562 [Desarmillaria tabescens]